MAHPLPKRESIPWGCQKVLDSFKGVTLAGFQTVILAFRISQTSINRQPLFAIPVGPQIYRLELVPPKSLCQRDLQGATCSM